MSVKYILAAIAHTAAMQVNFTAPCTGQLNYASGQTGPCQVSCGGKPMSVNCTSCGSMNDISAISLTNAGGLGLNAATDAFYVALYYPANKSMGPANASSGAAAGTAWDTATFTLPTFAANAKGSFLPYISYGSSDGVMLPVSATTTPFTLGTQATLSDPIDGKQFSAAYDGKQTVTVKFLSAGLVNLFLEYNRVGGSKVSVFQKYTGCSTVVGQVQPLQGGGAAGIGQLKWSTIADPSGIYPAGNFYLAAGYSPSTAPDASTTSAPLVQAVTPFSAGSLANNWSGTSSLNRQLDFYLSASPTGPFYVVAKGVTVDNGGGAQVAFSKSFLSKDDSTAPKPTLAQRWAALSTAEKAGIIAGAAAGGLLLMAAIYFLFFHKKVVAAVSA